MVLRNNRQFFYPKVVHCHICGQLEGASLDFLDGSLLWYLLNPRLEYEQQCEGDGISRGQHSIFSYFCNVILVYIM